MKALVYTGTNSVSLQDVLDPTPANGEALIKVEAVGICGSDMHAYHGADARRPAPLILGHEAAGIRQDTGARVTVNPLVTCGRCPACTSGRTNLCPSRQIISMPPREGAFAEFLTMPTENLVSLPDHITSAQAALAEPLAVCWHAVRLCAESTPLDQADCIVIGGGAIGFGTLLCLKAFGARSITLVETNSARAGHLRSLTECPIAAPEDISDESAELVIDAVGYAATRALACKAIKPGGVICHIGLGSDEGGVDIRRLTLQEITFFGTYAYTSEDFGQTCSAMFDGRLGALDWFELRPLSEGAKAFSDLDSASVMAPKIVLQP